MNNSYKITCSLDAGYKGDGQKFSIKFAEQVIEKWMTDRITGGKLAINGILIAGKLFFDAKGRRNDKKLVTISEVCIYEGNVLSTTGKSDKEITEALESLALELKNQLKQDKVFIIFGDKNWFI